MQSLHMNDSHIIPQLSYTFECASNEMDCPIRYSVIKIKMTVNISWTIIIRSAYFLDPYERTRCFSRHYGFVNWTLNIKETWHEYKSISHLDMIYLKVQFQNGSPWELVTWRNDFQNVLGVYTNPWIQVTTLQIS